MAIKVTTRRRRHHFKLFTAFLLGLGCTLAAARVPAQAVVTDPGHTSLTYAGWIKELVAQGQQYGKQIQQYQKQLQQYQQQIKQYEQQYVKGDAFQGKPGFREKFTERGLDYGRVDKCGQNPSNNPVGAEQYKYCVAIVQTENRRFNAMINVLRDVEKRDEELQATYKERAGINLADAGQLQSNSNRILAIQGQMQNDVQNAKTVMETYDALLRGLKEDQIRTANSALSKKDRLIGLAVQGAALRVALRGARARRR